MKDFLKGLSWGLRHPFVLLGKLFLLLVPGFDEKASEKVWYFRAAFYFVVLPQLALNSLWFFWGIEWAQQVALLHGGFFLGALAILGFLFAGGYALSLLMVFRDWVAERIEDGEDS